MHNKSRATFEYVSAAATSIPAGPGWTAIPIAPAAPFLSAKPANILRVQSSSTASFEISFDGVNPIALIAGVQQLELEFWANDRQLSAQTPLFARLTSGAAGAGELLTFTFVE